MATLCYNGQAMAVFLRYAQQTSLGRLLEEFS